MELVCHIETTCDAVGAVESCVGALSICRETWSD